MQKEMVLSIFLFYLQCQETSLHIAARTEEGEKCAEILTKSGANVNATKDVSFLCQTFISSHERLRNEWC